MHIVGTYGKMGFVIKGNIASGSRYRLQGLITFTQCKDAGNAETPTLDDRFTYIFEQMGNRVGSQDRLIGLAQCGKHVLQPDRFFLCLLAARDIAGNANDDPLVVNSCRTAMDFDQALVAILGLDSALDAAAATTGHQLCIALLQFLGPDT